MTDSDDWPSPLYDRLTEPEQAAVKHRKADRLYQRKRK